MKEIIIIVSPQGTTTIKTSGFSGIECQKETANLERALGNKKTDVPTGEMYDNESVRNQNRS